MGIIDIVALTGFTALSPPRVKVVKCGSADPWIVWHGTAEQ